MKVVFAYEWWLLMRVLLNLILVYRLTLTLGMPGRVCQTHTNARTVVVR